MSDKSKEEPKKDIKDVVSLYMEIRQSILKAENEYDYYNRMIESINVGSSLLPESSPLRSEAERLLSDSENFISKYQMDFFDSRKLYGVSIGGSRLGKITVRPEELEIGERCIRNQFSSLLIGKYKILDKKIFDELVKENILRRKTFDIGDYLSKDLIEKFLGEENGK